MIIEICVSRVKLETQGETTFVISDAALAGRNLKRLFRFEQGYFSQQSLQNLG